MALSLNPSLFVLLLACSLCVCTILDDYVNKPDSFYSYRAMKQPYKGDGFTTYFLNMTSQKWLTDADTSGSVWWHYLLIHVPDEVKYPEHGFLWITGGDNSDGLDDTEVALTLSLAASIGLVTGALFQVPNQPILFADDPFHKHRSEDAFVAYTFYHYCNDVNNTEYVSYLPMTKAAVRAMDTMAEFVMEVNGADMTKFMVSGASKRGWTTWLTGAVDERVEAIMPIVMDELNFIKNVHHQYRAYGGWTWAFSDYYDLNITARLDDPCTHSLFGFIDPLMYKDRLTMPKYIIDALGDEFFLPDDSNYYYDNLLGVKYMREIPDAEHSMVGHEVNIVENIRAFALSLLQGSPLPKVSWQLNQTSDTGFISVQSDIEPSYIRTWHATTIGHERRDFRLLIGPDPHMPLPNPVIWESTNVTVTKDSSKLYVYEGKRDMPKKGWEGFMIEMGFPSPDGSLFEITTQVNIIPNTFPFSDCQGSQCYGKLV